MKYLRKFTNDIFSQFEIEEVKDIFVDIEDEYNLDGSNYWFEYYDINRTYIEPGDVAILKLVVNIPMVCDVSKFLNDLEKYCNRVISCGYDVHWDNVIIHFPINDNNRIKNMQSIYIRKN